MRAAKRSMPWARLVVLAIVSVCGLSTCGGDEPTARAIRIESLDQAIGGPAANARVGDFLLYNDQVKVVIEGGRASRMYMDVGGSIIDADRLRPEEEFRGGRGLDQLGQIMPVANLFLARADTEGTVRITRSKNGAEVTSSAEAGASQKVLNALGLLVRREFLGLGVDHSTFRMYNEYELRPRESIVRMMTTVGFDLPFCPVTPEDGCDDACDDALYDDDCECPAAVARCAGAASAEIVEAAGLPQYQGQGLLDILFGDLPRPLGTKQCTTDAECNAAAGEVCVDITAPLGGLARVCRPATGHDAGVAVGDMLLFGDDLSLFVPGPGYDNESDFRRLFDQGIDTLGHPLSFDAIYAVGKDVSYGFRAPAGKVMIPIFGGSFSLGATGAASCTHDDRGCLGGKLVRFERWLAIGNGDVASARATLEHAMGTPLGAISGRVIRARSHEPLSGAEVFAFKDPRDLVCEGECQMRCGALPADAELVRWSVYDLMTANKCRSHDDVFLLGVAGLESVAETDAGTDPVHDGDYRMELPPGRYVLSAQDGDAARSGVAFVDVREGATAHVSFAIDDPATLEYAIFDEAGLPVAGRVFVGRCFPGASCTDDADCSAGDTCQAGACACARERLRPLELGGSRFTDGVLAFDETATGSGELELPPGQYDVVFTHGPHYTMQRKSVVLEPARTSLVRGQLIRTVNHIGWTAADFHVHAIPSLDSALPLVKRVTSFLAADMEFLSSSDHDVHTRYAPLLQEMGVANRLDTQIGVEVSPQENLHTIGWPLHYIEWSGGNRVDGNGSIDWRGKTPGQIFAALRALQDGPVPVVVEVPHPYTYFDYYRLDPITLEPSDSILTLVDDLLLPDNFSGDFDAMEVLNGKSFDLLRRPTIGELRYYSQGLDALIAERQAGMIDEETYQRQFYQLSTETTRRIMHRTLEEQQAENDGLGNTIECLCGANGDCAAGLVCDPATLTCVAPPASMGTPPPDAWMCRRSRGILDDWFNMLNRGVRKSGVGGSDTHGLYGVEAGSPRTLIHTGETTVPYVTETEIANGVRGGHVIVSTGPMVHFNVDAGSVGDTISKPAGQEVTLSIRVETAGWYDVDRVEIYRNGDLIHWVSGCMPRVDRDPPDGHDHPCVESGPGVVVAYDDRITDVPDGDSWYIVVVMGLDGRMLAPMSSSIQLARFGTFEVAQRIYDLIPTLRGLRTPRFPSLYPTFPFAVTNPIWVDTDGDGWTPLLPAPSWAP